MLVNKAPNAAGTKLSVTTTATNIFGLINTAASTTLTRAGFLQAVNGIDLKIGPGSGVRYLDDGNTPSTTEGIKLESGDLLMLRHINLDNLQLVSVSGVVFVDIRLGIAAREESSSIYNGSVILEATDIQIGAVEIKNKDTDDRAVVDTSGRLSTIDFSTSVPFEHDFRDISYVTSGNGIGEIETIVYKTGGSGGSTVATLTITYDGSDRVDTITVT